MPDEIIFEQASIIEEQAECIKQLSELARDAVTLLAQYQTVEAEEKRYSDIMKERKNEWTNRS